MSRKLPPAKFATLAQTLRNLAGRGPQNALRREFRLTEAQAEYVVDAILTASVALEAMEPKEDVIRLLVEDDE